MRKSTLDIPPFPLPENYRDAIALQNKLAGSVSLTPLSGPVRVVAGIDIGLDKRQSAGRAAVTVMKLPDLVLEYTSVAVRELVFPYIPGLLSFREMPAILKALACLPVRPDLLMVDGQGIAHPRRFGIAAHLGVHLDIPAIGVAKSRLCGRHEDPGPDKGSRTPLLDQGEQIGTVLRSRDNVKPLYISPGYNITHEQAVTFVMQVLTRYRLPEPTRLADKISKTA